MVIEKLFGAASDSSSTVDEDSNRTMSLMCRSDKHFYKGSDSKDRRNKSEKVKLGMDEEISCSYRSVSIISAKRKETSSKNLMLECFEEDFQEMKKTFDLLCILLICRKRTSRQLIKYRSIVVQLAHVNDVKMET
jgi:hypothetical protein